MATLDLGRVVGPQGIQGETGPQGAQGPRGIQGETGEAGKSAYQAAKDGGYTGTEAEFNAILAIIDRHAGRHKKGGADPLTAADVGAVALDGSQPMTGTNGLVLENKNSFYAIQKKRTINDKEYRITVGASSYGGVALELYDDAQSTTQYLSRFEVQKDRACLGSSQILHTGNISDYALPRDGSEAMTGDLYIQHKGYTKSAIINVQNATYVQSGEWSYRRQLIVPANTISSGYDYLQYVVYTPEGNSRYNILHTGTKPQGTYTGTGEVWSESLHIGGIGYALLFIQGNNNWIGFIAYYGAVMFNAVSGETKFLPPSQCKFESATGLLTINTTENAVNESGKTFYYIRL